MNKSHTVALLSKRVFFCFMLLLPFCKLLHSDSVFAEGQTKFAQDFFDSAEPITLKDPLAVILGAMDSDGAFVFTYADAVKFAGHSCPAVAGAYKSTQLALKALYGKETPVRGNINVTIMGGVDENVNGPISQIVSMITGAAAESGFKGFGPAGKYGRYNLMSFAKERNIPVIYGPMDSLAYKVELKHETWKNVRYLLESNVSFVLMSDHPVILQRMILLQLRWFIRFGLSKQQAIEIITAKNAGILGIDTILGSLEPDKWASFVCWNGDPFDMTSFPITVYGEGRLLHPLPEISQ